MPQKKNIPLADREITGLTWRQIIPIIMAIGAGIWLYFNVTTQIQSAQNVSEDNNQILQEIRQDRKEEAKLFNLRISDIENRQRTDNIRITLIEVQLGIKPKIHE